MIEARPLVTLPWIESIVLSTTQSTFLTSTHSAGGASWVWISVPGTKCSDGSETGFALSVFPGSKDLLVVFEGGGVCGDYDTCYKRRTSANIGKPFNEATFLKRNIPAQLARVPFLTRSTAVNPFYQHSQAWIPYCTGDMHAGNATNVYPPMKKPTYHHGFINGKLILQAIKTALPKTERVWMSGTSAGAFGAVYQYPNAVDVFGYKKRIDLIVDSAESEYSAYYYQPLNLQLVSKEVCPTCDYNNFDSFVEGYAALRKNSRFARLSFQHDNILPSYLGISQKQMDKDILRSLGDLNSLSNAKSFLSQGTGHGVLASPYRPSVNDMALPDFMSEMVHGDEWSAGM